MSRLVALLARVVTGEPEPGSGVGETGCAEVTVYDDRDGDGWGGAAEQTCTPTEDQVEAGGDCNDHDDSVFHGAAEVCDGYDNDCDGSTDEDQEAGWILISLHPHKVWTFDLDRGGQASILAETSDDIDASSTDIGNLGPHMFDDSASTVNTFDACHARTWEWTERCIGQVGGLSFGPEGPLFVLSGGDNLLVEIDTVTGEATPIGSVGFDLGFTGRAHGFVDLDLDFD